MSLERHHRRIRRKARWIHFGLLPLAIFVPLLWIYFALGFCQDAESPFALAACGAFGWTPFMPAVFGAAMVGWIAWDLARAGAEKRGARPHWRHFLHGYRSIDDRHRRHFHFAAAQVLIVGGALVIGLFALAYRTTH